MEVERPGTEAEQGARADPAKQEARAEQGSRAEPVEQRTRAEHRARAEPAEQVELRTSVAFVNENYD